MTQRNPRPMSPSPHVVTAAGHALELLEGRRLMSTGSPAYLIPTAPGVEVKPILSTGDSVNGYRMAGIPDGLGAYDNGDGTFTVLMNHELTSNKGTVRAHGSIGAFVSKWVFDKATGNVLSGGDLIKQVFQYDPGTASYVAATRAFNRFCSATLGEPTAYYNPATGLGTTDRIFTNGEEFAAGSAWAHVVTGPSAGNSYELAGMGNLAFENVVPNPYPQDLTLVGAEDDSSRLFTSEGAGAPDPKTGVATETASEVYFYVGHKKATGSVIDKAGLTGGILNGLKVGAAANETQVHSGDRFQLQSLGDVSAFDETQLQNASIAAGITQFRRPEDGAWDRSNPNAYYFVTTDVFGGDTRLWKLTFDDVTHPELGGKIEIAIDSPASQPGEMFDNVDTNPNGDVIALEDVGNNPYLGQVFQYDASTGDYFTIAKHDPRIFLDSDPVTPGVQPEIDADPYMPGKQGTQDEESSGVIDLSSILGKGHYLIDVQAHYTNSDPELVEGGQLLIINTNVAKATLENGVLSVTGTVNDDKISVARHGHSLGVQFNGKTLGTFDERAVDLIRIDGSYGNDVLGLDRDVQAAALVDGGAGNDVLTAGGGRSILIGGKGADLLLGGSTDDVLVGGPVDLAPGTLTLALDSWAGKGNYASRVGKLRAVFADRLIDDGTTDFLIGGGGQDWFVSGAGDVAVDRTAAESVG
jgi:Ca2+-binding RTX toxin-like protein